MKHPIFLMLLLIVQSITAQQFEPGNVIPEFGKTIAVPQAEFHTDTNAVYKVVFDVDRNFDPAEVNKLVETAARFLNMHEKAGVDPDKMHLALVFHGSATKDILNDQAYSKAYPETMGNPNTTLFDSLAEAGVQLILCGQSAGAQNIEKKNVHQEVVYALSAMTALVQLQANGFQMIKF